MIKDFISFANFGGGFILLGVGKDNRSVDEVESEFGPTSIADIIEKHAGLHLKFDVAYFSHDFGSGSKKVGLIYIYPRIFLPVQGTLLRKMAEPLSSGRMKYISEEIQGVSRQLQRKLKKFYIELRF